jgi:hypothetical protein
MIGAQPDGSRRPFRQADPRQHAPQSTVVPLRLPAGTCYDTPGIRKTPAIRFSGETAPDESLRLLSLFQGQKSARARNLPASGNGGLRQNIPLHCNPGRTA